MTETALITATLKRLLKSQGITYREVAKKLSISEPSIKRLFATRRFTLDRLIQISNLLGYTLAELSRVADAGRTQLDRLTDKQERELVSDTRLLLVAACALNHWTLNDITAAYSFNTTECLKYLLHLDKLRIIDLLPGNRIRLNVTRNFDWLPAGPITHYFQTRGQGDFLRCPFTREGETMAFVHGMMTEQAVMQIQDELRRLRQKFSALHEESLSAPIDKRYGVGLLLAMREWEPPDFALLRRANA